MALAARGGYGGGGLWRISGVACKAAASVAAAGMAHRSAAAENKAAPSAAKRGVSVACVMAAAWRRK